MGEPRRWTLVTAASGVRVSSGPGFDRGIDVEVVEADAYDQLSAQHDEILRLCGEAAVPAVEAVRRFAHDYHLTEQNVFRYLERAERAEALASKYREALEVAIPFIGWESPMAAQIANECREALSGSTEPQEEAG